MLVAKKLLRLGNSLLPNGIFAFCFGGQNEANQSDTVGLTTFCVPANLVDWLRARQDTDTPSTGLPETNRMYENRLPCWSRSAAMLGQRLFRTRRCDYVLRRTLNIIGAILLPRRSVRSDASGIAPV